MKIPLEWLKEFIDVGVSPSKLADRLTMAGTEVSAIEYHGKSITDVVVGKVKQIENHPSKEGVLICQIDTGDKILQVVTKSANLKIGDKVPIALHGATLPGGITVEKRELHGVESFGMLCSTVELGLSKEASGIMILDKEVALGEDIRKVIGVGGTVFEADILPNRGDCLSVFGIAREISAILNKPLKVNKVKVKEEKESAGKSVKVLVKNKRACPRYMARIIKNIAIKDSPKWMQDRLISCGLRPINNIVDITNYVLIELGQPLHAFDLRNILDSTIIVRDAKKGEKIKTLDGEDKHLTPDNLVIADARKALAIAGVMGGEESSVTTSTKTVLIESAYFNPVSIHKTEKNINLRTESSIRFEKGVDWDGVERAIDRAAQLIAEISGGKVLKGKIDIKDRKLKPKTITVRINKISSLLGVKIKRNEIMDILARLGFRIKAKGMDMLSVDIPLYRAGDVEREIDVIEEVARIYGYNELNTTLPRVYVEGEGYDRKEVLIQDIKQLLVNYGLNEAVTYSMVGSDDIKKVSFGSESMKTINISNAISADMNVMRPSILPNLLKAVCHNQNHQVKDINLFETGKVYFKGKSEGIIEKNVLSAVMTGHVYYDYEGKKDAIDFYYLKNLISEIFDLSGTGYSLARSRSSIAHGGKSADILIGDKIMGTFGEVNPDIVASYDLKGKIFFIDIDLDLLIGIKSKIPRFTEIPKYPSIERDIAMLVPEKVESKAILDLIHAKGSPIVDKVKLFDRYAGKQVKEGYYGLAYSISYRNTKTTLKDEEVSLKQDEITRELKEKLGIEVRIQ